MSPSWKSIPVKTLPTERFQLSQKKVSLRSRVKGLNALLALAFKQHEKDMAEAEVLYKEALHDLRLVRELATKMRDGAITAEERSTLDELLKEPE